MKIARLALVALMGLAARNSFAQASASDWQAEKRQAQFYYNAYEKFVGANPEARKQIADILVMSAQFEKAQMRLNTKIKALLETYEPDEKKRGLRAAAADAFLDLRLHYMYGNMLPRRLNNNDDALVARGYTPRPFPVRPLAITTADFKAQEKILEAQLGVAEGSGQALEPAQNPLGD
jgi:hypothetical protein